MDGDQLATLFIGVLFLAGGIGLLFVRVDEQAEGRDRKRGWLVLPGTHLFSPYYLFQVKWYKWAIAALSLILAAMFIAHSIGLFDRI